MDKKRLMELAGVENAEQLSEAPGEMDKRIRGLLMTVFDIIDSYDGESSEETQDIIDNLKAAVKGIKRI